MQNSKVCPGCQGSNFESDATMGVVVCIECGTVVEEDLIVAEVEFVDQGNRSRAVGQFVAEEGQGYAMGTAQSRTFGTSREFSIARARKAISQIASHRSIDLPAKFVDGAVTFYKMALERGLTKARCLIYVSVACLYIICRVNKTTHMLIDFSEVTQTDVFVLGRVFQVIIKGLSFPLPFVDPSIYVERFGHKLKLGDKTRDVCHTAIRLVGRMKRDWIHHGRRPSGLCGAALLVAAKLHGFQKSIKQIVRAVRISSAVLIKRLSDVSQTPTANLTVEEFFGKQLEDIADQDPPSFRKSRQDYCRRCDLEKANNWITPGVVDQVLKAKNEVEIVMGIREAIEMSIDNVQVTGQLISVPKKRQRRAKKTAKKNSITVPDNNKDEPLMSITLSDAINAATVTGAGIASYDSGNLLAPLSPPPPLPGGNSATASDETAVCQKHHEESITKRVEESNDERWSDVDDQEIDALILNEHEIELKTVIWNQDNAEFMIKKEELAKERAKVMEHKKTHTRTVRGPRSKLMGLSQSVLQELFENKIEPSTKSSKINYDVLQRLDAEYFGENQQLTNRAESSDQSLIDVMLDPKRVKEVLVRQKPASSVNSNKITWDQDDYLGVSEKKPLSYMEGGGPPNAVVEKDEEEGFCDAVPNTDECTVNKNEPTYDGTISEEEYFEEFIY